MTDDADRVQYLERTLRELTTVPEAMAADRHLTPQQSVILGLLLSHRGKVVSREQMMTALYWDRRDDWPEGRIVDVYLSGLRKRLTDITIRTIWGRGWTIDKVPAEPWQPIGDREFLV
jgi:DNA-binding response OmpR family regulator